MFIKDLQSITTLLKHYKNIEEDPDDNIWSFLLQLVPQIRVKAS